MIVDPQTDAVALMGDRATHGGAPVEQITTHISRIFLAGDRAWKMKRAVKLPYVDFSTPDQRLAACLKEVELNARTAPGLYIGVHELRRASDGRLRLDGEGELADAVIEMRRFEQDQLFDRMAAAGVLDAALMTRVALMIHRFHDAAPVVPGRGGAAHLFEVLNINEAGFRTSHVLPGEEVAALSQACRGALARRAGALDRRAAAGRLRRCHGDLHLRNICLLGGEPRLFDCIEFNDAIATVDVLYDLAFLLMDLWRRGLFRLANLVANRYFDAGEDEDAFALLPLLMAIRAAVRAHVTATQAAEAAAPEGLAKDALDYLRLASALLDDGKPRLVAIGGLSGSGKSAVADVLAPDIGPPPGARIIESDRVRKALFGVAADMRLPQSAYAPDVSRKVYVLMADHAYALLAAGGVVVADAVFNREEDRRSIETAAIRAGADFHGFWLEADPGVLRTRVATRVGGASDATVDVLNAQLEATNTADIGWTRLNAASPVSTTAETIRNQTQAKRSETVWRPSAS